MLKWVTFSTLPTTPTPNKRNEPNSLRQTTKNETNPNSTDLSRRSAAKTDLSRRIGTKTDLSRRSAAKTDVQTNPILKNEK
jgi:hypothetical protein